MLNRTDAPLIKDAVEFELQLKQCEQFSLDNGVPVYTIDAGAQDVLQIEMVFYAGNWFEQQKAVAAATNFMLKNGTGTRTAFQINEAFEYYGAYCNRACYNETAVISLSSLTKQLPFLLPVVKEMITDSIFPEGELDIYKQNSKQRLSVSLQKSDFVAARYLMLMCMAKHILTAGTPMLKILTNWIQQCLNNILNNITSTGNV